MILSWFLLASTALGAYIHQFLHTYPALNFDCTNKEREGQNAFVGVKYFYKYMSGDGQYTDLSLLTFQLWAKFDATLPTNGNSRQVLFSFVDGPTNQPYINVMLYIVPSNNQLFLGVINGQVTNDPIVELKISTVSNTNKLEPCWNQITLSIDQTGSTAYTNLKFFQSSLFLTFIDQRPYPDQKPFTYKFTQQSRITNEQFYGADKDVRACAYVANFEYYIGWVAMDTEKYVDYVTALKFHFKPMTKIENIGPANIPKKSESGISLSGSVGMKIYKDTQVEFVYEEQLDSFTLSFWLKNFAKSDFQLVSFSNDALLEPCLGFGVNKANKLLLYQSYTKLELQDTLDVGWNLIVASVYHISRNNLFIPNNDLKKLLVRINGEEQDLINIIGFKPYQRILIGFIFRDRKDAEYVDIQEVKIFQGAGTYQASGNCLLFIGLENPYCLQCQTPTSNHYCQENQNPADDTNYYICPAGMTYKVKVCVLITIPNCLRVNTAGTACVVCATGYTLASGACSGAPVAQQKQICDDKTLFCKQTTNSDGQLRMEAVICKQGYKYNNKKCSNGASDLTGCDQDMADGCYKCKSGFKKMLTECVKDCTPKDRVGIMKAYRFNDGDICRQYCPKYATYEYDCESQIYSATCVDSCPSDGITLPGSCGTKAALALTIQKKQGAISCKFGTEQDLPGNNGNNGNHGNNQQFRIVITVTGACADDCSYCYNFRNSNCLACKAANKYYDKTQTKCLDECDKGALLRFSNTLNKLCEFECPMGTVILDFTCIQTCPSGYLLFQQTCIISYPPGTYFNAATKEVKLCPQICKTCTDSTTCQTCVNKYPLYLGMCLPTCLPMYIDNDTNTCVNACQPTDYVYETLSLNGFAFKTCFQNKCGFVIANQRIQTVSHQTNNLKCMQPCDPGYYADYGLLRCMPCTNNCLTCIDKSNFCLTCEANLFFFQNMCFGKCDKRYQNYIDYTCVGGCASGYTINEKEDQACVTACGIDPYPKQKYSYRMQCMTNPPTKNAFCIGFVCDDCHYSCFTCTNSGDSDCTSCQASYLNNGKCGDTCPIKMNVMTNQCVDVCPAGSKTFQTQCLKNCNNNTYQYGDICSLTQPVTTWCNNKENYFLCKSCNETCSACTGQLSTDCTACVAGLYLYKKTCVKKCPKDMPFMKEATRTCSNSCSPLYNEDNKCVTACSPLSITSEVPKACFTKGCPAGKFKLEAPGFPPLCVSCYFKCSTCTGPFSSQCTGCMTDYYLQNNDCGTNCAAPETYYNKLNWDCKAECPQEAFIQMVLPKIYCVGECPLVYYWRICLDVCPYETYANGKECTPCAAECTVCQGSRFDQCSACDLGIYLDNTSCVYHCPAERPFSNLVTNKCVVTCPNYTLLKQMSCLDTCPSYMYFYELEGKKECLPSCYKNSYIKGQKCEPCAAECEYCYGALATQCIVCKAGYFLDQSSCVSACPQLTDSINKQCRIFCPPNLVLNTLTNQCLTDCPAGLIQYRSSCEATCPSYGYIDGQTCNDCDPICDKCVGQTINECTSCILGYYLNGSTCQTSCPKYYNMITNVCEPEFCPTNLYTNLDTKQCVATCPSNLLIDESIKYCLATCFDGMYNNLGYCEVCDPKCEKCTHLTTCSSCSIGYYLQLTECLSNCPNSDLYMDPIARKCQSRCPSGQLHLVSYGKKFCVTACPPGYGLFNDFCNPACPPRMYTDNAGKCQQCPQECEECLLPTNCTICSKDYYLNDGGKCALDCGTQLLNVVTKKCVVACIINEFEFNGKCLGGCPTDPILFSFNNQCISSCPSTTFRLGQECKLCAPECVLCNGPTSGDCLSCAPLYYLNGQTCDTTCPVGLLKDVTQLTCVVTCHPLQFINSDQCLPMCTDVSYNKVCITTCPASTYTFGSVCVDCAPECEDCNDTECLLCRPGFYLQSGKCGTYCPVVYDDVNHKCAMECAKPLYQYVDQCVAACPTVPVAYYTFGQLCVVDCPPLTAINGMDCLICEERCQYCNTPKQCTVCQDGYYLYNGVCLISCPQLLPMNDKVNWKCSLDCPIGTYIQENSCVAYCTNKIYNRTCMDECPTGYYGDNCSQCRSECKSCTSYQSCQSCSPNYFLEQDQCDTTCPLIKDTLTWTCTDKCLGLLYMSTCLSECPDNTTKQGNQCTSKCNPGYYQNGKVCLTCPKECVLCTSDKLCQSCSLGYYLNGTKCGDKCPSPLYGNYKAKTCVVQCPKNTYAHNGFCLFSCPKGYLTSGSECTQSCSSNKVRSLNTCLDCPVECKECTAVSNANCKSCAAGFKLEADLCRGVCPSGYVEINQMCQKCAYQCKSCETTIEKCKTCRGDRKGTDCLCPKGYFDDQFNDSCQQCPCLECTDEANCTVCKNNLQTPNCSCDRWLNDDWCITCLVGRVNVVFSDDLNSLIIDFGYFISIDLINPFQPSDCAQWFNNYAKFGLNSTCYLGWDRDQVIINLGKAATIEIGDQLSFKKQFYKDVNDASCEVFIEYFIDTTVNAPVYQMKPYVMFDVLSKVSACMEFNISQVSVWGTGNRGIINKYLQIDLKILKWELLPLVDMDHFYELEYFIQQQKIYLNLPINTLKPNTTYIILVKYVNMLDRVNSTKLNFTTVDQQKPQYQLNQYISIYVTFNPLIVKAYIFDCHVTYSDLPTLYTLGVLITKQNKTLISKQLLMTTTYQIAINESLLPRGEIIQIQAYAEDSIIDMNITLPLLNYDVRFLQKSRFLGTQGQINARGYDLNIQNEVAATMNFTYQWRCTNLYNLQPCKTVSNQIISFEDTRVLQIDVDSANTTFAFYCKVIKNGLWSTRENIIVITDLNIEMGFLPNISPPSGKINMNDDLFVLLKQPQQYAMIMHDYKLIGTVKIVGDSLKFKLADYLNNKGGSDIVSVYLIPGNDSLKFTINSAIVEGQLIISPKSGSALDQFTLSTQVIGYNKSELTYTYFYYDQFKKLVQDVSKFSIVYGKPLGLESSSSIQQVFLPNGIADNQIYLLCQVKDDSGRISYFNTSVEVKRTDYALSQLVKSIESFTTQDRNSTDYLQTVSAALEILKSEQRQVCLKQCSGVGTCIDRRCVCPPGYYFDDCSGNKESYEDFNKFLTTTLTNLMNTTFDDNVSFKMFVSSLKYLTSYPTIYDNFDIEMSKQYLNGLRVNLQNRLDKINRFAINIQYQKTDDFNYDQLDIQSIIQVTDLQKATYCTDLVWSVLLGQNATQDVYEVTYKLKKSLEDIIELSFIILQPDQSIDYSGNGVYLTVNRTSKIEQINPNRHGRILQTLANTPTTTNTTNTTTSVNSTNTTNNSTTNSTNLNAINSSNTTNSTNTTSTNSTNTNSTTLPIILNDTTKNTQYFDVIQAIYVRNLYFADGYFPYPEQIYPLYDYQIRKVNRKANIQLKYNMNYTFKVDEGENFVCITRNSQTYEWTMKNCETNWTSTQVNCNCSILAPTTIVDDYDYILDGSIYSRIKLPNIMMPIIFGLLGFWIIILMIGVKKDNQSAQIQQAGPSQEKYGFVQKLANRNSVRRAGNRMMQFGIEAPQEGECENQEIEFTESPLVEEPQKAPKADKYSVQYFQNHHCILNVIYKYKKYQPRWFRALLLLMRWIVVLTISGLYAYIDLKYEISTYAVIGSFIVMRVIESVLKANFQQISFTDQVIVKILLLILVILVICCGIFGLIIFNLVLGNQTDWILSYMIGYLVDNLGLDLLITLVNRYLGDEAKKSLRKKAKQIRQIHDLQQANNKNNI